MRWAAYAIVVAVVAFAAPRAEAQFGSNFGGGFDSPFLLGPGSGGGNANGKPGGHNPAGQKGPVLQEQKPTVTTPRPAPSSPGAFGHETITRPPGYGQRPKPTLTPARGSSPSPKPEPTTTPAHIPHSTPAPTPTPARSPTPTTRPTPQSSPNASPSPSPTPVGHSPAATPSPTQTPTDTRPTPQPSPNPSPTPVGATPTSTPSPSPTPTPTRPTPQPSPNPSPTPVRQTPTPTPTPTPDDYSHGGDDTIAHPGLGPPPPSDLPSPPMSPVPPRTYIAPGYFCSACDSFCSTTNTLMPPCTLGTTQNPKETVVREFMIKATGEIWRKYEVSNEVCRDTACMAGLSKCCSFHEWQTSSRFEWRKREPTPPGEPVGQYIVKDEVPCTCGGLYELLEALESSRALNKFVKMDEIKAAYCPWLTIDNIQGLTKVCGLSKEYDSATAMDKVELFNVLMDLLGGFNDGIEQRNTGVPLNISNPNSAPPR